jgi:50S ribosomal subunit-associated GTPase HflX
VCLTKIDLIPAPTVEKIVAFFREHEGLEILPISAQTGAGLEALRERIREKLTEMRASASAPQPSPVANDKRENENVAIPGATDQETS